MTQPLPDPALHIRVSFLNPSSAKLPSKTDNNTSNFTRKAHHRQQQQQQQWQGADDIKPPQCVLDQYIQEAFRLGVYVTLTVNNLCVFLSELLRRCEEGDAAGEEPDRRSEEQDEANPEGGQPTLGEETHAQSPATAHYNTDL